MAFLEWVDLAEVAVETATPDAKGKAAKKPAAKKASKKAAEGAEAEAPEATEGDAAAKPARKPRAKKASAPRSKYSSQEIEKKFRKVAIPERESPFSLSSANGLRRRNATWVIFTRSPALRLRDQSSKAARDSYSSLASNAGRPSMLRLFFWAR